MSYNPSIKELRVIIIKRKEEIRKKHLINFNDYFSKRFFRQHGFDWSLNFAGWRELASNYVYKLFLRDRNNLT